MNILFVCTGNTCRSPMAEGLLRQIAKEQQIDIVVRSAGVAVVPGEPASTNTDRVLRDRGIEMQHVSQQINESVIEWADIILTMTARHKAFIEMDFPHAANKVFTLKAFIEQGDGDVSDPFGGSLDIYRQTEKELEEAIRQVLIKVKR